ncbi:MAG: tetratricopeptide repeat protein, partial [Bradymonadia bacterium]
EWVQALVFESKGDLKMAEKLFRGALSVDFEHPYAGLSLARVLDRRGDRARAMKILDQLLVTRPNFVLGRLESARMGMSIATRRRFAQQELESLSKLPTLAPNERSLVATLLAEEDLRKGMLAEAEQRLVAVLKAGHRNEEVVRRLAGVYFSQSKLEKVKELLSSEFWLTEEAKLELWAELYLMMGFPQSSLERLNKLTVKTEDSEMLLDQTMALSMLLDTLNERDIDSTHQKWARERIEKIGERWQMSPALTLLYALISGDKKAAISTAREQSKRPMWSGGHRIFSWRAVIAWVRLSDGLYRRGTRALSRGKKMSDLNALEQWLKCQLLAKRLNYRGSKSACEGALALSAFEPARTLLADIFERREKFRETAMLLDAMSPDVHRSRDDLFRQLRAYYRIGQKKSIEVFLENDVKQTNEGVDQFARGLLEILDGKIEDGLSRLRGVLSSRKGDARTLGLMGEIFSKFRRPREAQRLFESAVKLEDEPLPWLGLGRLLLDYGQVNQALESAKRAEKLAKRSICEPSVRARAIALQAKARMRMKGRRNMRLSRNLLDRARRIDATHPEVLVTAGQLYEKNGKKKKAKDAYRRLLEQDESSSEAQFRLGRLLLSNKRTRREGGALLESLVRSSPESIWGDKARRLLP